MIESKWQILQFLRRTKLHYYLYRLHLAIFYISGGGYYSLSKRLTNIKYLSLRQQMDDDDPSTLELTNWFKVAGYLSILEMTSSLVLFIYSYWTRKRIERIYES
uniref:Pex N-terminal domain-containing protein n=1 Tax=Romanomermis culicivorax TaxID=13658 RepID=A0A915IYK0_ROMCU